MSGEERAEDQKKQRGVCAECKREYYVTRNGTIRMHGDIGPGSWLMNCRGSGQPPASLVADPIAEAEERGYSRAIEALLDDDSYRRWENANNVAPAGARSHVPAVLRDVCADYLGWHAAAPRNEGAQT